MTSTPNTPASPKDALKPCPFCGSEADMRPLNPEIEGNAWAQVICSNADCGLEMPSRYPDDDEENPFDEAARIWNTRADLAPLSGSVTLTTDELKAIQLAFRAIEETDNSPATKRFCQSMRAILVKQPAPQQEPVAWQVFQNGKWMWCANDPRNKQAWDAEGFISRPLYAAPPATDTKADGKAPAPDEHAEDVWTEERWEIEHRKSTAPEAEGDRAEAWKAVEAALVSNSTRVCAQTIAKYGETIKDALSAPVGRTTDELAKMIPFKETEKNPLKWTEADWARDGWNDCRREFLLMLDGPSTLAGGVSLEELLAKVPENATWKIEKHFKEDGGFVIEYYSAMIWVWAKGLDTNFMQEHYGYSPTPVAALQAAVEKCNGQEG